MIFKIIKIIIVIVIDCFCVCLFYSVFQVGIELIIIKSNAIDNSCLLGSLNWFEFICKSNIS